MTSTSRFIIPDQICRSVIPGFHSISTWGQREVDQVVLQDLRHKTLRVCSRWVKMSRFCPLNLRSCCFNVGNNVQSIAYILITSLSVLFVFWFWILCVCYRPCLWEVGGRRRPNRNSLHALLCNVLVWVLQRVSSSHQHGSAPDNKQWRLYEYNKDLDVVFLPVPSPNSTLMDEIREEVLLDVVRWFLLLLALRTPGGLWVTRVNVSSECHSLCHSYHSYRPACERGVTEALWCDRWCLGCRGCGFEFHQRRSLKSKLEDLVFRCWNNVHH